MKKIIRENPLFLVITFLFCTLLYPILCGKINEYRGPATLPEWINISKIINIIVSVCCLTLLFFFEKRFHPGSIEKLRAKGKEPILTILFQGFGLLELPSILTIIFFYFGGPVIDVYIYSILSFLGIIVWSWRQRAILISNIDQNYYICKPKDIPSQKSSEAKKIVQFVRSYNLILFLLGVLAFAFLALRIFLITYPMPSYTSSVYME